MQDDICDADIPIKDGYVFVDDLLSVAVNPTKLNALASF